MLNHSDIMSTVDMIDHQHLDIRTITMGISLLDCADGDLKRSCEKIYEKVCRKAEHLVKTGRRNLYYIKDKSTDSAAAKAKGFLSGMAAAGLDADGHVLETGETLEDGIRAVQQLLAEGIRPDGILCGEDLTAAGVLKALLRAGIRVPEETAVVGYDNSTYARLCEPELTSVDNKPEQVALLCVQLLQSRIEHGEDYSSVTLQPELVQRQSS